jgi:hypothetical protein
MNTHIFSKVLTCSCVRVLVTINYSLINDLIDIKSIDISVDVESRSIDVEKAYYSRYEKAFREEMLIKAADYIEHAKKYELERHQAWLKEENQFIGKTS